MDIKFEWIWESGNQFNLNGSLGCIPEVDNYKNYVVTVNWRYRGSYLQGNDVNNTIIVDEVGQEKFQIQETQPDYVPFEQLTEEDVIGWLTPTVNVLKLQGIITEKINSIVNPPIIYPKIPWDNSSNV